MLSTENRGKKRKWVGGIFRLMAKTWFQPPPLFKGGSLGFLNVKKGGTLPKLKIKGGRSFDGGISTKVI